MIRQNRLLFGALAASALLILGLPAGAEAAFQIRVFSNNVLIGTATDETASDTSNGVEGVLSHTFNTGLSTVELLSSSTKPAQGSAGAPNFTLGFTVVRKKNTTSATAAEDVRVEVTDTDYTPLPYGLADHIGGTLTVNKVTGVTYSSFASSTNTEFSQVGTSDTHGPFATASYNEDGTLANPVTAPYSITQIVSLHLVANAKNADGFSSTGGSFVQAVANPAPAPGGLLLALCGIPCLTLAGWLRRKRMVEVTAV